MNESTATRRLCKKLRDECGARVFSLVGGRMQSDGLPDRYVSHPIWTGWLEFKGPKTKLTALQKETIRWFRSCNAARGRGPGAWVGRFSQDWSELAIQDHEGATHTTWFSGDGPRELLELLAHLDFMET